MGRNKNDAGARFECVSLGIEIDFIMKPVLRGICKYESMIDGSLSVYDVALMNAALDVYDENNYRIANNQQ